MVSHPPNMLRRLLLGLLLYLQSSWKYLVLQQSWIYLMQHIVPQVPIQFLRHIMIHCLYLGNLCIWIVSSSWAVSTPRRFLHWTAKQLPLPSMTSSHLLGLLRWYVHCLGLLRGLTLLSGWYLCHHLAIALASLPFGANGLLLGLTLLVCYQCHLGQGLGLLRGPTLWKCIGSSGSYTFDV